MLVALNVDSIPGDFLPLLKIEGKFRFDSRRCGLLPSCILYSQGPTTARTKVNQTALIRMILEDLVATIEPHDVFPRLSEEARMRKESWQTYDTAIGCRTRRKVSWLLPIFYAQQLARERRLATRWELQWVRHDARYKHGSCQRGCRRRTVVRKHMGNPSGQTS